MVPKKGFGNCAERKLIVAWSRSLLVLRYWAGLDRISLVFLALIVVDNLVILGLGVLDYLYTGEFATYQFAIAAVLLYGVAFGKRDFARLDAYLKRKITKRKQKAR